jgi:DNA modification methylase
MNDINSSKIQTTTETPIVAIPCYAQPFYSFKDVQIYNENCLNTMRRMPDNYIDLTVTSPPYDNLRDYKGYSFPFEDIARELYRVTKQGGVVVWVVGDATVNGSETGTSFRQALFFMECGFNLHDTMIYSKSKPPINGNRYQDFFEYMFVFSKGKPNVFNPLKEKSVSAGGINTKGHRGKDGKMERKARITQEYKTKENIWFYHSGNGETIDLIAEQHPARFPEQLAADHIYSWSKENDIVYDCFGGSGTTVKMAHLQNRKAIMSEISKEYCKIAVKRIDPYLRQERLF